MFKKTALLTAVAGLAFAGASSAALVTPASITGWSGGDSYTTGTFGKLTDGVGITKGDPDDPSTWTDTATNYQDNLYDHYQTAPSNGQLGWIIVDLGSAMSDLDKFYVFNSNYNHGGFSTASKDVNVYYATAPAAPLPAPPGQNGDVDYDFLSGGWTSLPSLAFTTGTETQTVDLSAITAQYLALEIMTDLTPGDARVGFGEIAVTNIPEPGSLALLSLGALCIARRRRG